MIDLNNVSLVIATYNEEESIEFVLNELNSYEFFEIIVIDNNSSDKTLEIANKFNTKILQQKGRGWGNAVLEGLNAASGEYVTYMDADGSYNPKTILEMYQLLNDYDFVCGSRYKHGNKSEDDTFIRAIGNKIFTFITNHYLKLKISDSLFFYPLFKKSDYENINPKSRNFGLCIEVPYLLSKNNLRYTDILSLERKRYAGKSKVNAIKDGLIIFIEIIKMRIKN